MGVLRFIQEIDIFFNDVKRPPRRLRWNFEKKVQKIYKNWQVDETSCFGLNSASVLIPAQLAKYKNFGLLSLYLTLFIHLAVLFILSASSLSVQSSKIVTAKQLQKLQKFRNLDILPINKISINWESIYL